MIVLHRVMFTALALAAFAASTAVETRATGMPAVTPEASPTAKPIACKIPTPCAVAINSGSGAGYQGQSTNGPGLSGVSTKRAGVYGASGSGSFLDPGVDGESNDAATGGDAAGLFGGKALSSGKGPEYGVVAYGGVYGVFGETIDAGGSANPGYGVNGLDPIGSASTNGDFNVGVLAQTTVGTAALGEANASPISPIFGDAPIGFFAAATHASTINPYAFAFFGETNSFGVDIHNSIQNSAVYVSSPSGFLTGSGTSGSFSVDFSGNEFLSGTLTMSGSARVRTKGSNGVAMLEYGSRATTPQVEDVGEGQLANGRAYVAIDARLTAAIDRRVTNHVFVTPEGDCNGLYVTQKSPAGFAVRELRGGRASLAFEYRVVAKPVDDDGVRLATAPALAKNDDDGFARHAEPARKLPIALPPERRLRRRIGEQAYTKAVAEQQQR